jgi:hypothetical protein
MMKLYASRPCLRRICPSPSSNRLVFAVRSRTTETKSSFSKRAPIGARTVSTSPRKEISAVGYEVDGRLPKSPFSEGNPGKDGSLSWGRSSISIKLSTLKGDQVFLV